MESTTSIVRSEPTPRTNLTNGQTGQVTSSAKSYKPLDRCKAPVGVAELPPALLQLSKCNRCKNILSPPIWSIGHSVNVCGPCYKIEPQEKALRNEVLEVYLNYFKILCENNGKGCEVVLNFQTAAEHHKMCPFDFRCPFFEICNTRVKKKGFKRHLSDKHADLVKTFPGNAFYFENLVVTPEKDHYKIIKLKTDVYLFRIRHIKGNQVIANVFEVENKSDKLHKFILDVNEKTYVGKVCELNDYKMGDTKKSTKFNSKHVKNSKIKIEINYPPSFWEEAPKETPFKFPECPVCQEEMDSPIFLCLTGHSICESCRFQLSECPFCKSNYTGGRNFTLENMLEEVGGPKGRNSPDAIDCVLDSQMTPCPFRGNIKQMVNHVHQAHTNALSEGNRLRFNTDSFDYCSEDPTYRIMLCFDRMFRASFYVDLDANQLMVAVQLIGMHNEATRYKFSCFTYHVKAVHSAIWGIEAGISFSPVPLKSKSGVLSIEVNT